MALLAVEGTAATLATTDVYLRALIEIPTLPLRLKAMETMKSFEALQDVVMEEIIVLIATCNHIERSVSFKWLLGGVLAIGNLFNGGSALGGTKAFKTDFLGKLHKKWSRQRDQTLMHHLHQLLAQTLPKGSCTTDSSLVSLLENAVAISIEGLHDHVCDLTSIACVLFNCSLQFILDVTSSGSHADCAR